MTCKSPSSKILNSCRLANENPAFAFQATPSSEWNPNQVPTFFVPRQLEHSQGVIIFRRIVNKKGHEFQDLKQTVCCSQLTMVLHIDAPLYNHTDDAGEQEEGSEFKTLQVVFVILMLILMTGIYLMGIVAMKFCPRPRSRIAPAPPTVRAQQSRESSARAKLIRSQLIVHEWVEDDKNSVSTSSKGDNDDDETALKRASTDSASSDDSNLRRQSSCRVDRGDSSFFSSDEVKEEDCAICFGSFEPHQKVCESNNTACVHQFHEACMVSWLEKRNECPVCRQAYLLETV